MSGGTWVNNIQGTLEAQTSPQPRLWKGVGAGEIRDSSRLAARLALNLPLQPHRASLHPEQ